MFSVQQKRDISDAVQQILRATNHPELPQTGEISFTLQIAGAEEWSFAAIQNNGAVGDPGINPHNELMASIPPEEARGLLDKAKTLTGETPYMMDLREQVTAELNHLKDRVSLVEGKADGLIERVHGPSVATPDEHLREIVENKWLDLETRLKRLEDRDEIHRKLYSEVRFGLDKVQDFLTPIIEDNVIQHHSDQLNNLATAIRQLGSPKVTGGD
jgi:hypothetical protein